MNVDFEFDYVPSDAPLLVTVGWPGGHTAMDLNQSLPNLSIDFNVPLREQTVEIVISCSDIQIVDHPLTIKNITLDNFYSWSNILYSGIPKFDQQFLLYAERNNMFIDSTVADVNTLSFTGTLTYKFIWPFYKNIFK